MVKVSIQIKKSDNGQFQETVNQYNIWMLWILNLILEQFLKMIISMYRIVSMVFAKISIITHKSLAEIFDTEIYMTSLNVII